MPKKKGKNERVLIKCGAGVKIGNFARVPFAGWEGGFYGNLRPPNRKAIIFSRKFTPAHEKKHGLQYFWPRAAGDRAIRTRGLQHGPASLAMAGFGFWGGFGGVLPVFRGVLRFRAGGVLLRLCFYN